MIRRFIISLLLIMSVATVVDAAPELNNKLCYLDVCTYEQVHALDKLDDMLEAQTSQDLNTLNTYDTLYKEAITAIQHIQSKRKAITNLENTEKHEYVDYTKYISGMSALIKPYGLVLNEEDLKTIDDNDFVEYYTVKGATVNIPDTNVKAKTDNSITYTLAEGEITLSGIKLKGGKVVSTGRLQISKKDSNGKAVNPLIK